MVPPLPETSASKAGLKPLEGAHGTHNLWSHRNLYWSPGLDLPQRAWAPGRNRRFCTQIKAQRQSLSLALTSEACELEHDLVLSAALSTLVWSCGTHSPSRTEIVRLLHPILAVSLTDSLQLRWHSSHQGSLSGFETSLASGRPCPGETDLF